MKVLVTGGAGYVGSHVVRELAAVGHEVSIYDNLVTGHSELCAGFPLTVADIADRDILRNALEGKDAIMHFAASTYVNESMQNPQKYFRNNVGVTLDLLDSVMEMGVRLFIFSSSCAVYGAPSKLPILESFSAMPLSPYGETKLFLERVLSAYAHTKALSYVALRYFNAAGAHTDGSIGEYHMPETHVIPLALKAILGLAPPLKVFGNNLTTSDGSCMRDFVHVSDLATAHVRALHYLAHGGSSIVLNLGSGKGTTIYELLALVQRITGRHVPHEVASHRFGDPPALYADPSLAMDTLNWSPQFGLEDILRTAWNWEKVEVPRLFGVTR